jgi:hypothetical protein
MITNKESYKENKEISFILAQLEIAIEKGDYFSSSVLITRLRRLGYKIVEDNASHDEQAMVQ